MARKPSVLVKHEYDADTYRLSPDMETSLIRRIRECLDSDAVRRYWNCIAEVAICVVGDGQAYLYVALNHTHCLGLRDINPFYGKKGVDGCKRYLTFAEVRFSSRYWLPRIRKALANGADYQGFAANVERGILDCWHKERFRFWDVLAGINAVLRAKTVLGGYRLQFTAAKIPKEGDPMPHLMDLSPCLPPLRLDVWVEHALADMFMLFGKPDYDKLILGVAQQDPFLANGMRRLIDITNQIGALKADEKAHKDEIVRLQEQAVMIQRQLRAHLAARAKHGSEAAQ